MHIIHWIKYTIPYASEAFRLKAVPKRPVDNSRSETDPIPQAISHLRDRLLLLLRMSGMVLTASCMLKRTARSKKFSKSCLGNRTHRLFIRFIAS